MEKLLAPFQLGKLTLKNRIFMSPMSRCRADFNNKTSRIMETYYEQRSTAGCILSEPIAVSIEGLTGRAEPGMWSDEFIDGWKRIIERVNNKDGIIFGTLSHGGRASIANNYGGILAPSAVYSKFRLENVREDPSVKEYSIEPKAMTLDDINRILDCFHQASIRIKKAGFNGIHLHASSGCLVESFMKSKTNKRTDRFGDPAEFTTEILKRFKDSFDDQYIGIKIAPVDQYNNIYEENPKQKFKYIISEIKKINIGLIEIKETCDKIIYEENEFLPSEQIKSCIKYFNREIRKDNKSYLIANFGTKNIQDAIDIMENDISDFVSCASFFISNPNLPEKIKKGEELILPNVKYYSTGGEKGYIDYL